jgi:D-alanyl-D-alanine carboxypeptidase
MTSYVTFRAIAEGKVSPATKVTQTQLATDQEPVSIGLSIGTKLTLENALKLMIVPSANDMAVAIAETVGGSLLAFVDTMNAEAARLGLGHTHFDNPSGLPGQGQVSSARDLAVVARRILTEFPERRGLFGIQAVKAGSSVFHSPNLLLLERYRGADGMKTGFTCASGYNVAATATRNGRTVLAVVLGRSSSRDRAELAARLLDAAFQETPDEGLPSLADFTDSESDAGPVDMRLCSGAGVDRVGFTTSVLGSVVAVRDPVPVVVEPPPAPAKPVSSTKSAKPASKPAAKPASSSGKSVASTAAKGTSVSLPTDEKPLTIAVPTAPAKTPYRIRDDDN